MKIYTKTGDKGRTSLFDGTRVLKDNIRVDTYGTVDELNSILGIVISFMNKKDKNRDELLKIQHNLFEIGAVLANPKEGVSEKFKKILGGRVDDFEKLIDMMTTKLPELNNFILPGGSVTGAFLQLARSVCRRSERRIISLSQVEEVDGAIIIYFNRLSDLLFTLSRYSNLEDNVQENVWLKKS